MKRVKLMALTILAFAAISCSESEPEETYVPPIEVALSTCETNTMKKQNNLGYRLLKAKLEKDHSVSTALSPYSLSQTLAMLANGATGVALDEIVSALNEAGTNIDEINAYYKKINAVLPVTDKKTKIEFVNALWGCEEYKFLDDFVKTNKEYYGAITQTFSTYDEISNWYKQNMPEYISAPVVEQLKKFQGKPFAEHTAVNNTAYFNGIWDEPFKVDEDKLYEFLGENGIQKVKMMYRDVTVTSYSPKYFSGQHSRALSLRYGNGAFSMVVVLPHENANVDMALDELADGGLECMTPITESVFIRMPRFEHNETIDLLDLIDLIGLSNLRNYNCFPNIQINRSNAQDNLFKLWQYLQTTQMKVDEIGTEVKVTTSAISGWGACPPEQDLSEFIVDRPFIWLIKENSTGTILFLGKVGAV